MSSDPRPPVIARVLLLTLTPARWRQELDGDLREGFSARRRSLGIVRARVWYWRQLVSIDVINLWSVRRPGGGTRRTVSQKRGGTLDGFRQDLRYALRSMTRQPGVASVILVTLALVISVFRGFWIHDTSWQK